VAVDASGNLFIADVANNRIRKVDAATGIMTTVAGSGAAGYCGDGVPATSACLNRPAGVTLDASGNVFVADAANNRIRKVDAATGIMTTVAGNGTAGYCGDGVPATSACLNRPARVTLDAAGNLFIADTLNRRIRKVEASPDVLGALRLYDTLLSGCIKTNGTVTLTEPAPVGGLTIVLHSDNPNVVVPASFTVWEGMRSGRFQIVTSPVAARETATIFASVSGQVLAATLTLKPMVLKDLTLAPNLVVGGNPSGGTMTLQCPAAPGDIEVTLASSNPSVANPTVSHITIPFGTQVMTFDLATTPVTRVYTPAVSATANGVKRSRPLTVNPVP
jgi:hypothetical protein